VLVHFEFARSAALQGESGMMGFEKTISEDAMADEEEKLGGLWSRPARQRKQAASLWIVGVIGLLGLFAQIDQKNYTLAVLLGVLSPAVILLGIWLWNQSRKP
jgi:hypothetical protein